MSERRAQFATNDFGVRHVAGHVAGWAAVPCWIDPPAHLVLGSDALRLIGTERHIA